jgi:hypothetical protein
MRGGWRPGSGRPKGATSYRSKPPSYKFLEKRLRELDRRGTEDAKKEGCKVAALLLPHDMPRLQAVMAQTETKVTYVARLPSPIEDIEEWQRQMMPLLIQQP